MSRHGGGCDARARATCPNLGVARGTCANLWVARRTELRVARGINVRVAGCERRWRGCAVLRGKGMGVHK